MTNVVVILSLLTACVSAISPLLTTVLNNIHQRKLREQEVYYEHHFKAVETYIRTAGAYLKNPTEETAVSYGLAYGEIFLYAPESLWQELEVFNNNLLLRQNPIMLYSQYTEICKSLSRCHKKQCNKAKVQHQSDAPVGNVPT